MTAVDYTTALKRFDEYCERVTEDDDEAVFVTRQEKPNVVLISEERFHELERAEHNLRYLNDLRISIRQMQAGEVLHKTMEELEAMVADGV